MAAEHNDLKESFKEAVGKVSNDLWALDLDLHGTLSALNSIARGGEEDFKTTREKINNIYRGIGAAINRLNGLDSKDTNTEVLQIPSVSGQQEQSLDVVEGQRAMGVGDYY